MRYVLIITIHADPAMPPGYEEWGGTHTYMKELIDGFAERGIRCVMFTRNGMNLKDIEQYNDYCTVIRLRNGDAIPIDKKILWTYHEDNLEQIQAYINENGKPDIIHSVYWNSGRLAMELGCANDIEFVHSVISNSRGRVARGATLDVPKRAEYEQQIYESAKWIICVSNDEKDDIVDFYNIKPNKIVVAGQYIHQAFLLPARDMNGFPRLNSELSGECRQEISKKFNSAHFVQTDEQFWNNKAFTYMGRVAFSKGVGHIINAWYQLYKLFGEVCPPLWIAGGSIAEINATRELVKADMPEISRLERKGSVVWWGYLDVTGLSTILLKTSVLIMHSQYEPGGRVIVEAMAEGVPVIATPYGFGKDYVENWKNGFLVEFGDVKELLFRLTHFVRQPFLSDSLGQNARQDAKRIIEDWNFFDNHLMAYGFKTSEKTEGENTLTEQDFFKARRISLFPYHHIPLSEKYIKDFVSNCTKDTVLECDVDTKTPATSSIYRLSLMSGNVVVKQAFSRLRIGPLFNPFDNEHYVKKASKAFAIELNVYKRLGSEMFLGYDSTHHLIALKELTPLGMIGIKEFTECVDFLMTKPDIALLEEKKLFCDITSPNLQHKDDVMAVYQRLDSELDYYYFERSGSFSEKVAWNGAIHILEFNENIFLTETFKELQSISRYFRENAEESGMTKLRSINTDVKFKHLMRNNDKIEIIDLEKSSLGYVESEIADLICDFLSKQRISTSDTTLSDLLEYLPNNVNKSKVLSHIAHNYFYEIQVICVMERVVPEFELAGLRNTFYQHKTYLRVCRQ